jgi:phosphoribosylformimino-5-aminoimidazole carboxamide ribotide isomerase
MELYPAIDLRDGGAVRLTQGDFSRQQGYGDPLELAASYIEGGATWIHVVDLNAARTGRPHERATLAKIVALGTRVQTGGGIRTEDDVAAVLDLGAARVVMGTAALEDPALAARCARRWPGRVAVGLDYSGNEARGHGWEQGSGRTVPELLAIWADEPIGAVVATEIARDGMLEGPDLAGLGALRAQTQIPVIASGGVATLEDLRALAALDVAGVIVGKALVEHRFSVEEAVAACSVSV